MEAEAETSGPESFTGVAMAPILHKLAQRGNGRGRDADLVKSSEWSSQSQANRDEGDLQDERDEFYHPLLSVAR